MKRRLMLIIGMLILVPTLIEAGEIYGEIWVKKTGQAASGAKVSACDRDDVTDSNGVYSIKGVATDTNKCNMSVEYNNKRSIEVKVYISNNRTRADFELNDQGNQWWLIRR